MLVVPGGERIGSISGGCLEEDIILRSASAALKGVPEVLTYDTTADNDLVWGVGQGCHGVVTVLIEPLPSRPAWALEALANLEAGRTTEIEVTWDGAGRALGTRIAEGPTPAGGPGVFTNSVTPPSRLLVFGAGDDARPLARLALGLGWRVAVADPRPAYVAAPRFPGVHALVHGPAEKLVSRLDPSPGSLAVVMTHHYRHDLPLLRHLLPLPLSYLGLLGPRQRAERILSDLEREGLRISETMRRRLHAPAGLDLGAEGGDAIALSIMAEMVSVIAGRDAHPLRERTRPIHG
jgi:xanthine/CO dehydrogenase XdhC/CoxF family maturation factor